jgi:hypothetical protein
MRIAYDFRLIGYLKATKSFDPPTILSCSKESDDLLMSVNIIVSLVINISLKTIHLIEEDALDIDES